MFNACKVGCSVIKSACYALCDQVPARAACGEQAGECAGAHSPGASGGVCCEGPSGASAGAATPGVQKWVSRR